MPLPLVSVIIPTYNSARTLEKCLQDIHDQDYENVEIITIDNHSTDESLKIAQSYTDKAFTKGPERTAQKNHGISQASGKYILTIDGDMYSDPHLISECVDILESDNKKGGICIPLEDIGRSFWVHVIAYERDLYKNSSMQAARFLRKDLVEKVGGYKDIIFNEEFIVPQQIDDLGCDTNTVCESQLYHDYDDFTFLLNLRKKFYYGKSLQTYKSQMQKLKIVSKSSKQTNILHRYSVILSQKKAYKKPFKLIGLLFLKTCEFTSGALGLFLQKK